MSLSVMPLAHLLDLQAATPSGALRALDRLWAVPQKLREAVMLGSERAAALDDMMRAYMFVIPKVWLHACCPLTGDDVLPAGSGTCYIAVQKRVRNSSCSSFRPVVASCACVQILGCHSAKTHTSLTHPQRTVPLQDSIAEGLPTSA